MIGYRQPAHFNITAPKRQRLEFCATEEAAKEMREEMKADGLKVRITACVNFKHPITGAKVYTYKVEGKAK